jgi:hypothetical protein
MSEIVLGDVNYWFPPEYVQGAYLALKILDFTFDEKRLKLAVREFFGFDFGSLVRGYDACVIIDRYVIPSETAAGMFNWMRGYFGVFNVLKQKPQVNMVAYGVGTRIKKDIETYLPPTAEQVGPLVPSPGGPVLPQEIIGLIYEHGDFFLKQQMKTAFPDQSPDSEQYKKYIEIIKTGDINSLLVMAAGYGDERLVDYALTNGAYLYSSAADRALLYGYTKLYHRLFLLMDIDDLFSHHHWIADYLEQLLENGNGAEIEWLFRDVLTLEQQRYVIKSIEEHDFPEPEIEKIRKLVA